MHWLRYRGVGCPLVVLSIRYPPSLPFILTEVGYGDDIDHTPDGHVSSSPTAEGMHTDQT